MSIVTEEMESIMEELFLLAMEYKNLYAKHNTSGPVVWIQHDETREAVFISDSFNAERIKSIL